MSSRGYLLFFTLSLTVLLVSGHPSPTTKQSPSAPNETTTRKPHVNKHSKFIFPRTKWCGIGNAAKSYEELGQATDTDRCCRDHDTAVGSIKSGNTKFGLKNTTPYTIKSCDADERFRQCLIQVNSPVSNAVGTFFFDILKMKCYDYRKPVTCEKRSLYGLGPCSRYRQLITFPEKWRLVDAKPFKYSSFHDDKEFRRLPGISDFLGLFN